MIRVLYVDDEEALLEVGKEFLENSGLIRVDTAISAKEAEKRLHASRYDAIVSDYQMPVVNGIEFLKKLRSQGNLVPFILFTGRGREDVVIEALNSGADFYLQKGGSPDAQFLELEHKVREAVRRSQAEKDLRDKLEMLAKYERVGRIGTWVFHADTNDYEFSEEGLRILGADVGAATGVQRSELMALVHPDDRERFAAFLEAATEEARIGGELDFRILWVDGSTRHIHAMVHDNALAEDGKVLSVSGFDLDVTDRRAAELAYSESEERFSMAFHSSATLSVITNRSDLKIVDINDQALKAIGYAREEVLGRTTADLGIFRDAEQRSRLIKVTRETGQVDGMEVILHRRDGDSFPVLFFARPLSFGGEDYFLLNMVDLTGMARAEQERSTNEVRYRLLFEQSHDAIILSDIDGTMLSANPAACALFGMSEDELKRAGRKHVMVPDDSFDRAVEQLLKNGKGTAHLTYRRRDGSTFKAETTSRLFHDAEGRARTSIVISTDSERKHREEALRMSGLLLRGVLVNFPAVLWAIDSDGLFTLSEGKGLEGLGLKPGQVVGQSAFEVYKDFPIILDGMRRGLSGEENTWMVDVGEQHFQTWAAPILDEGGEVEGMVGVSIDVTERIRSERALDEGARRLRSSLDNMIEGCQIIDSDWRYLYLNAAAEKQSTLPSSELIGRRFMDVWPGVESTPLFAAIKRCLEEKAPLVMENLFIFPDGSEGWFDLKISPVPEGFFILSIDVTDRRRAEEASKLSHKKLDLLAQVTRHDLNNQLLALSGMIRLLERAKEETRRAELIEKMDRSVEGMRGQLEFAKQYQEIGEDKPRWQNLHELIGEAKTNLQMGRLQITEENTDVRIFADPMMQKVVLNLIGNTLQHSGGARHMKIAAAAADRDLIVSFQDDGKGISDEDRPHLFERGHGRHTGFGLFLSREVLGITGITIAETGKAGEGARFELRIPAGDHRPAS